MSTDRGPGWYYIDNLFYRIPSKKNQVRRKNVKLAAFDLHETLMDPLHGKAHVHFTDDWQWTFPSVPTILREYHENKYTVAIFSNHTRFRNRTKQEDIKFFMERIEYLISLLGFEPYILVAIAKEDHLKDEYSKPATGMYETFLSLLPEGINISDESFYVGDRAGMDNSDIRYRKAGTDREFAKRIGLVFYTPAEIFETE